ncbi:MAG: response regulator [Clostridia bacterium]|nr:response regulator [Clostridia bacterium]
MKYNVLLVGKLDNNIRSIHIMMKEHFDVQLCMGDASVVDGMFKLLRPKMIFISLTDYEQNSYEILKLIEKKYSYITVVILGNENDFIRCSDFIDEEKYTIIKRPISINEMIKTCYEALGIMDNYQESSDKKDDDRKYILMVDDNAAQIRTIKGWLEEKYKVHSVLSGIQALNSVMEKKPDLILLDYEMPLFNGKQVLEKLRENKDTSDIDVIFLTSVSDKKHIIEVMELKPAGYLLKPVARKSMLKAIEDVFSNKVSE